MKILFVSRRFYPEVIGGGQISALYLAKAAKAQNNDVSVCTFSDGKESEILDFEGLKIHKLPIPKLKLFPRLSNMDYMYFQMAALASDVIRKVKPDILHLLNFESIPFSSIYFKKRFGIPIVATVNGTNFGCFTQNAMDYKKETCTKCRVLKRYLCSTEKWGKLSGSFYYLYSHWYMNLLRMSYKSVDKFLIVSTAMKPLLTSMAVPEKKIELVHNPVVIRKKNKTDLKKRLKIGNKKIILYAGRLDEYKGIHYTIRAMKNVENAVFLVLGEKRKYYKELAKLVDDLDVNEKVKFLGFIEQEKLPEFYSIADLVVLVEDFYEPLSRFLLEACSYGIPIIASDSGGNREIVEHNKNGILVKEFNPVNLAKEIDSILSNKSLHKKMSNNSVKKATKKFEINVVGEKLNTVYTGLVS